MMDIERELDKTKSAVFLGSNAAFLGSVLCSVNFIWDKSISTACINGLNFKWNPDWFISLPIESRKTVLLHELWHIAKMHSLRVGNRNHKIFNYACDYHINNDLEKEGYTFAGTDPLKDSKYGSMSEEEIYDLLIKEHIPENTTTWGIGKEETDFEPLNQEEKQELVAAVIRATHVAEQANQGGSIPGTVREHIDRFLAPVVPWENLLLKFFTELENEDFTWRKPNRRYQDIYLPSRIKDESKLEHLLYCIDVSGSISKNDIIRTNSEIKYIKERFNPEKLTILQFDTKVQKIDVYTSMDCFNYLDVIGRGGTHLECVREYINEHKPTAAVVFSDLHCPKMHYLNNDIPVIWIVLNNKNAKVNFGKMVHINV